MICHIPTFNYPGFEKWKVKTFAIMTFLVVEITPSIREMGEKQPHPLLFISSFHPFFSCFVSIRAAFDKMKDLKDMVTRLDSVSSLDGLYAPYHRIVGGKHADPEVGFDFKRIFHRIF
jgi:hypothetical protein